MTYIPFLIIFLVVSLFVLISIQVEKRASAEWHNTCLELANQTGLSMIFDNTSGRPFIDGDFRGFSVKLDLIPSSGLEGTLPSMYTMVKLSFNKNIPGNLNLRKRNILEKPKYLDEFNNFANEYIIRGHPDDFVRKVLSSDHLRKRLSMANFSHIISSQSELQFYKKGIINDSKLLFSYLNLTCYLGNTIEKAIDQIAEQKTNNV
ncbi:MAG: hypothetical protein PVG14_03065 [Anaerolineales bacterium]|jgi:hypothetical protein